MQSQKYTGGARVAQRILFSLLASLPGINVLILLGGSLWSARRRRARLEERRRILAEAAARGMSGCQACKHAGDSCPGCDGATTCHGLRSVENV